MTTTTPAPIQTTTDQLQEIRDRAVAATPGEWEWFGNTDHHHVYLATKDRGRLAVMMFNRWGMQGAQPLFAEDCDPNSDGWRGAGRMAPTKDLARYEVAPEATDRNDPRVYRGDIRGIRNADAVFIAKSRADVDYLLGEVDRLRARLAAVERVAAEGERNSTRWENPIPIPAWVGRVRQAARGESTEGAATTLGCPSCTQTWAVPKTDPDTAQDDLIRHLETGHDIHDPAQQLDMLARAEVTR